MENSPVKQEIQKYW